MRRPSLPEPATVAHRRFHAFKLVVSYSGTHADVIPKIPAIGQGLEFNVVNRFVGGSVGADWVSGSWRIDHFNGTFDLAKGQAFLTEVIASLGLPIRRTGDGPNELEHTSGHHLEADTPRRVTCELPGADVERMLELMRELGKRFDQGKRKQYWSARPSAEDHERDALPFYERIFAAGLPGERVTMEQTFSLPSLDALPDLYERLVEPNDSLRIRASSFPALGVTATLELRVKKGEFGALLAMDFEESPDEEAAVAYFREFCAATGLVSEELRQLG